MPATADSPGGSDITNPWSWIGYKGVAVTTEQTEHA